VLPGNEGRNYVLRMVMRRAMRYGRKIGFTQPFLYEVCQAVIDKMGGYYTELVDRRDHITNTIKREEEGFARTLESGLSRLSELIGELELSQSTNQPINIPGETAFRLYDTYGLPLEITRDVAKESGFGVDEAGFEKAREAAKEIARSANKEAFAGNFDQAKAYREAFEALKADGKLPESGVRYDPYGTQEMITGLVGILRDGEMTDHAVQGESVEIVLHDTPFYVESGGQVSDTGKIESKLWKLKVLDTRRPAPGFIVHSCQVAEGAPRTGDPCVAYIDKARRASIKRNHTATHLLQKCLRSVLGNHVGQQGSLVAPDRLRFDFSHGAAMTHEELDKVSDLLNDAILRDMPVWAQEQSYKEAIASGAMAFFSEKYGDVVRVVRIGFEGDELFDPDVFSAELCGGTHVMRTGEIGSAVVLGESAVAAGVRRIEVLTGKGALEFARKQRQQISQIAQTVNATSDTAAEQVSRLNAQLSEAQKQLERAQRDLSRINFNQLLDQSKETNGTAKLIAQVSVPNADTLREMSDWFREKHPSGVVVLGSVVGDKPSLVVSVSDDLTKKGVNAGKLIKEIAAVVGGGGGGKPTLAYAGGKDPSKLGEALAKAEELLAGV
jgi:alanyl-tRNA synthetase